MNWKSIYAWFSERLITLVRRLKTRLSHDTLQQSVSKLQKSARHRYVDGFNGEVDYTRICFDIGRVFAASAALVTLGSANRLLFSLFPKLMLLLAAATYAVGFAIVTIAWLSPRLKSYPVLLVSGFLALIVAAGSESLAARVVHSLTKMDPDDFSRGTKFLAGLLAPFTWLWMVSLVVGLLAIVFAFTFALKEHLPILPKIWFKLHKFLGVREIEVPRSSWTRDAEMFLGALALSFFLTLPLIWEWPRSIFMKYPAPAVLIWSEFYAEHPCTNLEEETLVSYLSGEKVAVARVEDDRITFSTEHCVRTVD